MKSATKNSATSRYVVGQRVRRMRFKETAILSCIATFLGALIGLLLALVDGIPPLSVAISSAAAGLMVGATIGAGEAFLVPGLRRRISLLSLNCLRLGIIVTTIFVALLLSNVVRMGLDYGYNPQQAAATFFRETGARDLTIVFVVSVLVTAAFAMRRLYSPGELWHHVIGRYDYPRNETRVVLFADLIGSTRTAERLGPLQYSEFIRRLFADISEPILGWQGSILQYTGDGFIVTWTRESGLRDGACVRCFIDIKNTLLALSTVYAERYGVRPRLTCGIHVGDVVVTRVGEARMAMTYLGDAMNVAARLESLCRGYACEGLVSADTIDGMTAMGTDLAHLGLEPVGTVDIRGRSTGLRAYALLAHEIVRS